MSSALIFGSAMDDAVTALLLRKKKKLSADELTLAERNPVDIFMEEMLMWNGEYVPTSTNILYSKTDFESRLVPGYENFMEEVFDGFRNNEEVSEAEHILYNFINWYSLVQKGLLLIAEYEKEVMPQIEEVTAVQKHIHLKNADGDILRGILDLKAKLGGKEYVLDNKTSARPYKQSQVKESQQLMIYCENEQNFKAGFIVMVKDIKFIKEKVCERCGHEFISGHKSCPKKTGKRRCDGPVHFEEIPTARIQILTDELDPTLQEKLFWDIQDITTNIKNDVFDKNWESCYHYGRKCPYYKYCRSGSMEGLVREE